MENTSRRRIRRRPRWVAAFVLVTLLFRMPASAQTQTFQSLEDLFAYADARSAVAAGAQVQSELARLQAAAAIANTVNLRGTASFSMTDNFKLPVNFLPAEIFGGPAGTFRQVTFGQQFVNVAAISPQLDVINPSTWARVKSARTSTELTDVTNALNRRNLKESIATAFFNYRSAERQLEIAQHNLANADTIAAIVGRRFTTGIVRKQDYNNTLVNRANLADFVNQLETRMQQQVLTLQALLGIPENETLTISKGNHKPLLQIDAPANSQLLRRQAQLQADLQRSELLANRLAFMPTVSVVAGFNWQQNSNEGIFNSSDWIRSQYVGLRLSVPIPTETKLWSQAEEYRINLKMKQINAQQVARQESIQNQQLRLEADRATEALVNVEAISKLKYENYQLALLNYTEGILSEDLLLTAFTDLLNAELTEENARWNLQLQLTKIQLTIDN
jgi:outer membrane protein TolC